LQGMAGFRPRLKKAAERLEQLRSFAGMPLPAQLRRLMARHRLLCEQLQEIEAARDRVATALQPDQSERMIQHLAQIVGLGLETATLLVREMFCRRFRDTSSTPAGRRANSAKKGRGVSPGCGPQLADNVRWTTFVATTPRRALPPAGRAKISPRSVTLPRPSPQRSPASGETEGSAKREGEGLRAYHNDPPGVCSGSGEQPSRSYSSNTLSATA
jgi:hypothetical protein